MAVNATRATALAVFLGTALGGWSCGGSGTPTGPSGNAPRITAISPTSGPTSGGTSVTITGEYFSAGAIVTIGGTPATSVSVISASTISAITAPRSAGAADVVVTVGGRTATLAGGFTYVRGQAPVIRSIAARGSRPNEPERFADLGEEITVTATVEDADTPASGLAYGWASPGGGTFTGTGPSVRWRAPQSGFTPPGTITLSLSVSDGGSTSTGNVVIRVHDSVKEVTDMARQFLDDFSRQIDPNQVVRNFREECGAPGAGRESELFDVRENQRTFDITQYTIGQSNTTINFGGSCTLFSDRFRPSDACALVPVVWTSTCINERRSTGERVCSLNHTYRTTGTDQVTASYANDRWWLCDSDLSATTTDLTLRTVVPGTLFKR